MIPGADCVAWIRTRSFKSPNVSLILRILYGKDSGEASISPTTLQVSILCIANDELHGYTLKLLLRNNIPNLNDDIDCRALTQAEEPTRMSICGLYMDTASWEYKLPLDIFFNTVQTCPGTRNIAPDVGDLLLLCHSRRTRSTSAPRSIWFGTVSSQDGSSFNTF